jgi:polysaccharide chain length determinant protein (PEP-CTERM system associated)
MYEQLLQLRMYLSGMWKYRWFGIAASWLVCISVWTFVYFKPDVYEATGKIQIDMNSLLKPILKGLAVDTDQSNTVTLMTRKLMSRPVLERIIRETDLGLAATNEVQMEYLIDHLRNTISIQNPKSSDDRRDRSDSIVVISYEDPNPKLSYAVVKKVIDTLVENTLGANRSDTDVAHAFLAGQIKEYEKRLYDTEQKLADFKKKNVGLMPSQGGGYYARLQTATDGLRQIESDLQLARNKVTILKSQIQQEMARSVTASYDKKIQEHEDKLSSLLLQFTAKHPDVQAEKSIIESLKKSKQEAITNAANNQSVDRNDDNLQLSPVYQNLQIALKEAEVNVSNIEAKRT